MLSQIKKNFKSKYDTSGTPKEIYNFRLWLCLFVFGIFGSARGYDEGYISAVTEQVSFINLFNLEDPNQSEALLRNLVSNIKSMVQLGSIGGALIGGYTNDKFGRVRSLQGVCFFWIVFVIIQMTAKTVGQLYAGRLLEGLVIGQTVVIGPTYLSEIAPKRIRGLSNGIFSGAVYFGIMLAYFANLGTAIHISDTSKAQWIVPTSVKIMLAIMVGVGSLFCYESPRWLVKVGRNEQALHNLSKIRNLPEDHPYVVGELNDVYEQLNMEFEAVKGSSILSIMKELFMQRSNRYRILLTISAQILSQWSGANALTVYTATIFELVGIEGKIETFVYTAILGVVKFAGAYLCAFFLIDFIGRRRSLYTGLTIQFIAMLYIGVYLKVYPADVANPSLNQLRAGKGGMAMIYISGVGWTMGWNSIQYLLGAEIFPLRLRSVASSMTMVFHFLNQYGNSKALPSMLSGMDNWGTFIFFAAVLLLGFSWAWFFLPELSNRSLESMDELFSLPWYLVGRRGNKLAPDHSTVDAITRQVVRDHEKMSLQDWEEKGRSQFFENKNDNEAESIKPEVENVESIKERVERV